MNSFSVTQHVRGFTREVQHHAYAPQPNCKFNVDANSDHAFGILLAAVGALRPAGLRRQLTSSLGLTESDMNELNSQQDFIYREITILAWGASVQRAKLYNPHIPLEERESNAFKNKILTFIETDLLPKYKAQCSESDHVENIQRLVNFGNTEGGMLLGPDGYKFGVAQKLLNLLLKYLWCLGHVAEPPHCPVDRIVLAKTALRDRLNWTEIKTAAKYNDAINAISAVANATGLSIAQWELQFYNRR